MTTIFVVVSGLILTIFVLIIGLAILAQQNGRLRRELDKQQHKNQ